MPCCCATNVKAAFVLGIVLAAQYVLILGLAILILLYHPVEGTKIGIISGVIGVLIQCILIFGAHKRHRTAILVWMVLTILSCIYYAILAILGIVGIGVGAAKGAAPIQIFMAFIPILFLIGYIILLSWTIDVAKKARKEIQETENDLTPLIGDRRDTV